MGYRCRLGVAMIVEERKDRHVLTDDMITVTTTNTLKLRGVSINIMFFSFTGCIDVIMYAVVRRRSCACRSGVLCMFDV